MIKPWGPAECDQTGCGGLLGRHELIPLDHHHDDNVIGICLAMFKGYENSNENK